MNDTISKAQQLLASFPLPSSLKEKVREDLEDATNRGFAVDLEQLGANLTRLVTASRG